MMNFWPRWKKGDRWQHTKRQTQILEGLKSRAREQGLWNFWLTDSDKGYGLNTVEYAYLAEQMGKAHLGAEVFNCSAPDTGNMEVLERYGREEHKRQWLNPLLEGENSLGLFDERTRCCLIRCHKYFHELCAR